DARPIWAGDVPGQPGQPHRPRPIRRPVGSASPAGPVGPPDPPTHRETSISTPTYDAILFASFGGPEGQDDVIPFLRNVTAGRGVRSEERRVGKGSGSR